MLLRRSCNLLCTKTMICLQGCVMESGWVCSFASPESHVYTLPTDQTMVSWKNRRDWPIFIEREAREGVEGGCRVIVQMRSISFQYMNCRAVYVEDNWCDSSLVGHLHTYIFNSHHPLKINHILHVGWHLSIPSKANKLASCHAKTSSAVVIPIKGYQGVGVESLHSPKCITIKLGRTSCVRESTSNIWVVACRNRPEILYMQAKVALDTFRMPFLPCKPFLYYEV